MRFIKKKIKLILYKLKFGIKLSVGSGDVFNNGWINSDINTLDITKKQDWSNYLLCFKANIIFAEHVWEHIPREQIKAANSNCFLFLKKGGTLRIAVPDGYNPNKNYIDAVKPGGDGAGSDDHKVLYNYETLKTELEFVGFKVILLEYWDENGNFHYNEWTDKGGRVRRSKRYDERNKNGELNYTSLIVDAVKL